MCYNGTFRFKKLDDSFWNGETFRFADYTLMFLRAHGRKSMPVCLETLLFLCSYVLLFSALAADFTIHEQRNATFSPHRHMLIVIR